MAMALALAMALAMALALALAMAMALALAMAMANMKTLIILTIISIEFNLAWIGTLSPNFCKVYDQNGLIETTETISPYQDGFSWKVYDMSNNLINFLDMRWRL